jgi:hypothetical protein
MAITGPTQLPAFLADDATFRQWAQGIHNALVGACGMVQTADTGQIALATVLRPTVVNTYAGYEILRFNDALQAQTPIFLKIEYGVDSQVDRPSLAITMGQGSNGAGTLTGTLSSRRVLSPTASKTTGATLSLYASGAEGRMWLLTNADFTSTSFGLLFGCERACDETGTPVVDGWTWYTVAGGLTNWQAIPRTLPASVAVGFFSVFSPNDLGKGTVGTNVGLNPVLACFGKMFYLKTLIAAIGDVAGNSTFTVNYLNAIRTYLSLNGAVNAIAANSVNIGPCLPWE